MIPRQYLHTDLATRFWARVAPPDESGHRRWLGAHSQKRGYPPRPVFWVARLKVEGYPTQQLIVPAFRMALALADGVPLDERVGLFACHAVSCSQPWCVNPEHGYWGTEEENRRDRYPETGRAVYKYDAEVESL